MIHRNTCTCDHHPEELPHCVAHGMASVVAKEVARKQKDSMQYIQILDVERATWDRERARAVRCGWSTEPLDVFKTIYDTVLTSLRD